MKDSLSDFKNTIDNLVDIKLNKKGITRFVSAKVTAVNPDGTINVYLPPDITNTVSNILNKTGETLSIDDSVELGTKNGKVNNSWVALKHGTNVSGGGSGSSTFIGLNDTPSTYSGSAGKILKVNSSENALIFSDASGTGDVTGPSSSTDNAVVRFNGTTGKTIQNSLVTIDDSGNLNATNLSGTNTGDQDLSNYVTKITGKGLSTEDYTTAEKTKLSGIAEGAEVNVNADWNATSGDAQILNKPTIPTKISDLTDDTATYPIDKSDSVTGVTTAGNDKYYGTNGSGTAGFYSLPSAGVSTAATDTTLGLVKTSDFMGLDSNNQLDPNVRVYDWDGNDSTTTPSNIALFQKVYDDVSSDKSVLVYCKKDSYRGYMTVSFYNTSDMYLISTRVLTFSSDSDSDTYLENSYDNYVHVILSSGTVTSVPDVIQSSNQISSTNFLRTDYDYPTPYIPLYDGSPATKKYVDDNSGGGGDVTGPSSSVDNHVVTFNGITGKIIKDSGLTLSGSNTGDETTSTIKTKLGITTLSGSNTGDQDLSNLVVKETGKGLSTNDYTTTEKNKLAGIAEGAEVNVNADWNSVSGDSQILNKPTIPTQYTDEMAQDAVGNILVDSSEIDFTYNNETPSITASLKNGSIDETKLDTSVNASLDLADSAVQSADLATVATTGSYNDLSDKPTIPAAQIQSDWNQTNNTLLDYIKNKPTIPSPYTLPTASITTLGGVKVDGSTITITDGVISSVGGGAVDSVNGETGVVVLTQDDIGDGTTYIRTHNDFTDTLESKLNGIESGAEVNVQSDWNATSGDALILNKPTAATSTTLGLVKTSDFIGLDANDQLNPNLKTYIWDGKSGVTTPSNIALFQKIYDDFINNVPFIVSSKISDTDNRRILLNVGYNSSTLVQLKSSINSVSFSGSTTSATLSAPSYFNSITISSGTVTEVSALGTSSGQYGGFLETDVNYSTPYTPLYDGSPATKKYVDDNIYTLPIASSSTLGGVYSYSSTINIKASGMISVNIIGIDNPLLTPVGNLCTWDIMDVSAYGTIGNYICNMYEKSTGSEVICELINIGGVLSAKIKSNTTISSETYSCNLIFNFVGIPV